jgi:hypothetical protein
MRIAVMAAGAVGGYFGARLAAAKHDVFFIARGANLAAIRTNGLKVESVLGDLHLPHPNVTDDPAKIGPVEIVLFAVPSLPFVWRSLRAGSSPLWSFAALHWTAETGPAPAIPCGHQALHRAEPRMADRKHHGRLEADEPPGVRQHWRAA